MKKYKNSIFIFRRDLRVDDNTGLMAAQKESSSVLPIFIVDPIQTGKANQYKSNRALQFMLESLLDLDQQLKKGNSHLYIFYGAPQRILEHLITTLSADAIFINEDYTPYSKQRDALLETTCSKKNIPLIKNADELLHQPTKVLKANGSPYTVFTPYFKQALSKKIAPPQKNVFKNFYTKPIKQELSHKKVLSILQGTNATAAISKGGRTAGKKLLKQLSALANYATTKDIPIIGKTSRLSPHLKFGTISIREAAEKIVNLFGTSHPLIRQLFWRDFFTYITYHFPHVYGAPFKKNYASITWATDQKAFQRWCNGNTGFPIVDAGMRELNKTGFINGRMRMIVASFLTKDLHSDWQLGEKYFATQLIDYDPSLNNGNWQWVASTGCDAQPYFRIFNPWQQQKKFDAECLYIKKWVPELAHLPAKIIHTWFKNASTEKDVNYPQPMINHSKERIIAKNMFSAKNYKPSKGLSSSQPR